MARAICESAWAARQLQKICDTSPTFRRHYDDIAWRLARDPDLWKREGWQVPDRSPPVYLLETTVMRPIGIPAVRILYQIVSQAVEVVAISIVLPP